MSGLRDRARGRARGLRRWFGAATLGLTLLGSAAPVRADDEAPKVVSRTATLAWDNEILRLTVSYRDVVDAETRKKLTSGLPTVIVLRGYVFEEGSTQPIALTAKSCRVVFDPWDEVFRIQLGVPGSETNVPSPTLEGVLRRCAEDKALPVVEAKRLKQGTSYFISALVEVNPISREMIERIRRWVSRPAGASGIGAGDALFGSFVGLFTTRIGVADRQFAFRTQSFQAPAPPPPPPPAPAPAPSTPPP
jgi:hypothetical protein